MTKLLKRLGTRETIMAIISVIFVATQVWLDLKLPDYMSEITILVKTPGSAISDVWRAGGKMMLCATMWPTVLPASVNPLHPGSGCLPYGSGMGSILQICPHPAEKN